MMTSSGSEYFFLYSLISPIPITEGGPIFGGLKAMATSFGLSTSVVRSMEDHDESTD